MPELFSLPLLLVAVALVALVAIVRRPGGPLRSAVGVALAVFGIVFGGILVLAGFFGDLSGEHRIAVVPLVGGVALIAACSYGIWRIRRAPARSASGHPTG